MPIHAVLASLRLGTEMKYSPSTGGFYTPEIHASIPDDAHDVTEEERQAILSACRAPDATTPERAVEVFTGLIQNRLDTFARTRNYDNIQSACSYMLSSVERFADEGAYAMQARDATWSAAYAILAEVQAGTRPVPASLEDIDGDLPALEWPQ